MVPDDQDAGEEASGGIDRDNKFVGPFLIGSVLASAATLAISTLLVDYGKISLWWAWILAGFLGALACSFGWIWWRRGVFMRRLLGVTASDLTTVVGRIGRDVRCGNLKDNIDERAREIAAVYVAVSVRRAAVAFAGVLLAEFVLLVNAAMLIKQTAAIEAQTKIQELQTDALERQNELLNKRSQQQLFWDLYNGTPSLRAAALSALRYDGMRDFSGLVHEGADFSGERLSGFGFQFCTMHDTDFSDAEIVRTEFTSCSLKGARFWESKYQRGTLKECNLENSEFAASTFVDLIFEKCSFKGATFNESTFAGCEFRFCDFSEAVVPVSQFTKAKSFFFCEGLPDGFRSSLPQDVTEEWDRAENPQLFDR